MKKYLLLISTAILASCSQGNRDWEPDRSNSCPVSYTHLTLPTTPYV